MNFIIAIGARIIGALQRFLEDRSLVQQVCQNFELQQSTTQVGKLCQASISQLNSFGSPGSPFKTNTRRRTAGYKRGRINWSQLSGSTSEQHTHGDNERVRMPGRARKLDRQLASGVEGPKFSTISKAQYHIFI